MSAVFFDMDGTLINGDTNEIIFAAFFKDHLIDRNFIKKLSGLNEQFYQGTLDIKAYYDLAISPLQEKSLVFVESYIGSIVSRDIIPIVFPGAKRAIQFHKDRHDTTFVVTTSADYIAKPVARALGIDYVIAGDIVVKNDRLTNQVKGVIPYQQDKVVRIKEQVKKLNLTLEDSYGYGDSINDLPMLSICTHRYAVNPNEKLLEHPDISSLQIVSWTE